MTQAERIIAYIEAHGSITPYDAIIDLGITKLATRVSEMRRFGYKFKKVWEEGTNRYGETTRYMRYYLIKE